MNDVSETGERALARGLRRAALAATCVLIALVAGWVAYPAPSGLKIAIGTVLILPLALALRGLHAGNRRTYAWTTLTIVPSLVLASTEAVANAPMQLWAGLCLLSVLTLFALLITYIRVGGRSG